MSTRKKIDYVRVNLNLPKKLLENIKSYSHELGIPYSHGIIFLLDSALDNQSLIKEFPIISELIKKQELGQVSPPVKE